jgi:glycosyltransferase involved in cell wall biosynthesis
MQDSAAAPYDSSVSVVIPAYNVADYVGDAVRSVLRQTYPVREIICVDDGSTDGTLEKLRALETAHPERVRVLTGANAGAPTARNRGLAEASAKWVQFLDADDVLLPEKLESQIRVAERGGYDVVCGGYESHIGGECVFVSSPVQEEDAWVNLFKTAFAATTTMLFRRAVVVECGGWTEGLPNNQDYDLVYKLLKCGARIGYDPRHTSVLQRRAGSISFDFTLKMRQVRMRINEQAVAYLRLTGGYEGRRRREIEQIIFTQIRQMYPMDPEVACNWYRTLLGSDFTPPAGSVSSVPYRITHRVLGFSRTEALRARIKNMRGS